MTTIAFGGDVHGHLGQIKRHMQLAKAANASHYIQLGDYNLFQDRSWDRDVQHAAEKNDLQVYFIDGNHDNFPYLNELNPDNLEEPIPVTHDVHYLPRNSRLTIDGLTFHAMGGAHSIDENYRTLNRDLYTEEDITPENINLALTMPQADILLSHDSPLTSPNPIVRDAGNQRRVGIYFGEDVLQRCHENQERLTTITEHLQPSIIFHGHYHRYYEGTSLHTTTGNHFYTYGLDEGSSSKTNLHLKVFTTTVLRDIIDTMKEKDEND